MQREAVTSYKTVCMCSFFFFYIYFFFLSTFLGWSICCFATLPVEVSFMVPRRKKKTCLVVENHTLWQTERRQKKCTSRLCSLQQWTHQRLLTCFFLLLVSPPPKKGQAFSALKVQTNSVWGLKLGVHARFSKWSSQWSKACSLRGDTVMGTWICDSALTLLLCSQPLPEAANGFAHWGREDRGSRASWEGGNRQR